MAIWDIFPFEALLTSNNSGPQINGANYHFFHQYPFLIYNHQISYVYSSCLLYEFMKKKTRARKGYLLAIAPEFNESNRFSCKSGEEVLSFSSLNYTKNEISAVGKYVKGRFLRGKNANKESVSRLMPDYSILHLATHGKANDRQGDFSYLAVQPDKINCLNSIIYARELYSMDLNADLVVLSACETGTGEFQRGEGVISLARAFSFAGARSIVTSLWSVNDKSSYVIMDSFYKYLEKGQAVDLALRNAKLEFLRENNSNFAHPAFWSTFIPIGDMNAVKMIAPIKFGKLIYPFIFFLLLLLVIILKRFFPYRINFMKH